MTSQDVHVYIFTLLFSPYCAPTSKVDASWDEAYWGVPHPDQLGEIISKGQ